MEDNNFEDWIWQGDEWIVSYLSTRRHLRGPSTVHLFSIAHAIELYLKGYITKKYNLDKAIKKKHNLFSMYKEVQVDLNLFPEITQNEFDSFSLESNRHDDISLVAWKRAAEIEPYLILFKYIVDFKYNYKHFRTPIEKIRYSTKYPELKFTELFFKIREYLKLDWIGLKDIDLLKIELDSITTNPNKDNEWKILFLKESIYGK